jgi:hypothetical protein
VLNSILSSIRADAVAAFFRMISVLLYTNFKTKISRLKKRERFLRLHLNQSGIDESARSLASELLADHADRSQEKKDT